MEMDIPLDKVAHCAVGGVTADWGITSVVFIMVAVTDYHTAATDILHTYTSGSSHSYNLQHWLARAVN